MKNILVIKLRYIGDVLLATPALRALREGFPDARLTVAVNRGTEPVLKQNPDVDEVLTVLRGSPGEQWRFVQELRRRRFDCVVDLTDGDRSAILARLSGAPVRIGFNEEHRWRGLLYTTVVQIPHPTHRMDRDLEAVRALGIEPKAGPLVLHTSSEDDQGAARVLADLGLDESRKEKLIWFQPGARYWFKAWPAERFADLADRLAATYGCRVLIGGDASERETAEAIRKRTRSAPTVLAGRTTLLQSAALIRRCVLFVGNDNGPMHMAAAMGIPVVALFGPSNPVEWGPRGGRFRVLYKGLDCRRCFHPTCLRGEDSCMNLISVDEVYAAAQELLTAGGVIGGRI
ncbi:MAG TPA: putative lipopolysaccharide heptosyltransferase III [Nitrospiraceae bacterium]|jgi:predicted lipopolysaccharide heptosyltransferase III|nr:putative lipopolysaccharide heptosyltransferase III [Nitrospiraceae bacterium]